MKASQTWLYVAALVVFTAAAAGCGQQPAETEAPQLVRTVTVGAEAEREGSAYSGTVRGRYESALAFQAGGRITARNVQLGSVVHAGDVLMTVDPKDVVQSVYQAQAQVSAAQAQLQLAEANLARYKQLFAQDAVSAAALDQYQTAYDQAAAQYQQAAALQQAQENQLSYTNLTADADGVVSALSGEVGQVVAAGQTVLTLVHSGELEVQIDVPENKLAEFPVGQAVTLSFWALPGQTAQGTVREVSPMADAASRTYAVRVAVPSPPEGMQLGMTASVHVGATDGSGSYTLPLSALYQTGDAPQVWVVGKDGTLSLKTVSVEGFGDNTVAVTGVAAGDVVVTAGVHMLREGQKVRTEGEGT